MLPPPPGNPLTSHCTPATSELFTVAVKDSVVPVVTVIDEGETVTDTPPKTLAPLNGAEPAPPQLRNTESAINRSETHKERSRTPDIAAPLARMPREFVWFRRRISLDRRIPPEVLVMMVRLCDLCCGC